MIALMSECWSIEVFGIVAYREYFSLLYGLLFFVFALVTFQGGFNDLLLVPVAIAITLACLPFEIAIGRRDHA